MTVFYHASERDRSEPMHSVSTVARLHQATKDSLALIEVATHEVAKNWREPGRGPWRYSKAGSITCQNNQTTQW